MIGIDRRPRRGNQLQGTITSGALISALLAFTLSGLVTFAGFFMGNDGLVYAGMSITAFLIPLCVGLTRKSGFDPFEPINLIAVALLYGSTIRSFYLLSASGFHVQQNMWFTTFDRVNANMPLILLSILALCCGYLLALKRVKLEHFRFVRNFTLSRDRLWLAIWITVAVSLVGIPYMFWTYGISLDTGILATSQKRYLQYESADDVISGAGASRYVAFAVGYGFTLLGAYMIAARLKKPRLVIFLTVLGLMSAIMPFVTSSRSTFLLLVLNLTIFAYYYHALSRKVLLIVFVGALLVLAAMGELRAENQSSNVDGSFADQVIGSGNSVDLVRTSSIMDRVPERVDFMWGKSYLGLLVTPIPRAVWPEKPQIGLGGYVKKEIFGQQSIVNGWPSGMIAEGWMNFGYFGLFAPLFFFGMFLRWFYETFRPFLGKSFPVTLLYATIIWRLGFSTIGLNFAHGLAMTLVAAAPIFLLLLITNGEKVRRPQRVGAQSAPYGH